MDTKLITLVVLVNLLFLGVLVWKAAWLMRKIRAYPREERRIGGDSPAADGAGGMETEKTAASAMDEHGADDGLRSESNAHEQADKQQ